MRRIKKYYFHFVKAECFSRHERNYTKVIRYNKEITNSGDVRRFFDAEIANHYRDVTVNALHVKRNSVSLLSQQVST